jgi:rubrerythrin
MANLSTERLKELATVRVFGSVDHYEKLCAQLAQALLEARAEVAILNSNAELSRKNAEMLKDDLRTARQSLREAVEAIGAWQCNECGCLLNGTDHGDFWLESEEEKQPDWSCPACRNCESCAKIRLICAAFDAKEGK